MRKILYNKNFLRKYPKKDKLEKIQKSAELRLLLDQTIHDTLTEFYKQMDIQLSEIYTCLDTRSSSECRNDLRSILSCAKEESQKISYLLTELQDISRKV